jgi:hypothetical protein
MRNVKTWLGTENLDVLQYLPPTATSTSYAFDQMHRSNFTSQWKYVTTDTFKIINRPTLILRIFSTYFKSAMLIVSYYAVLNNLTPSFYENDFPLISK